MAEREHGAGRQAGAERDEVEGVAPLSELHPANEAEAVAAEEDQRHRRVMASAELVMRKHRSVFAVLAR